MSFEDVPNLDEKIAERRQKRLEAEAARAATSHLVYRSTETQGVRATPEPEYIKVRRELLQVVRGDALELSQRLRQQHVPLQVLGIMSGQRVGLLGIKRLTTTNITGWAIPGYARSATFKDQIRIANDDSYHTHLKVTDSLLSISPTGKINNVTSESESCEGLGWHGVGRFIPQYSGHVEAASDTLLEDRLEVGGIGYVTDPQAIAATALEKWRTALATILVD
ncbi:MAG: hypothetical protein WC498_01400 [Candidatus Saccharimonadales bacterium]